MARDRSWTLGLLGAALIGCWGGPVPQAPECAAYVRCIEAIDAQAGQLTNLDRFEEVGVCWSNSEQARGCTTACERALERMAAREPTLPPECAP